MRHLRRTLFIMLGLLVFTGANVMAQGSPMQMPQKSQKVKKVTDHELELFADVTAEAQKHQTAARKEITQILNDEGMDFRRYQQIMMSRRNPKMAKKVDVSKEEKKTLKKVKPEIQQVQQANQKKVMKNIQDSELSMQRFQQIFRKLRQDKQLMQRYRQVMQEQNGGGQDSTDS